MLHLRRLMKFCHTVGAAGFMGGLAALVVMGMAAQADGAAGAAGAVGGMARVAAWVIAPSMILTVVSGMLAMAVNPAFYDVAWVWVKLATGILVLEGSLHVLGPLQEEAKRMGAGAAGGEGVATLLAAEGATLWVLLGVSAANVALAVWRPRMPGNWD